MRPFTPSRMPACFDHRSDWELWCAARTGAISPCGDCAPSHKAKMCMAGRCERQETLFLLDVESGEICGVSSDEPRYAELLRGQWKRQRPIWPWVDGSPGWKRKLEAATGYAAPAVARAITGFLRSHVAE